jgi:hypothetical protein
MRAPPLGHTCGNCNHHHLLTVGCPQQPKQRSNAACTCVSLCQPPPPSPSNLLGVPCAFTTSSWQRRCAGVQLWAVCRAAVGHSLHGATQVSRKLAAAHGGKRRAEAHWSSVTTLGVHARPPHTTQQGHTEWRGAVWRVPGNVHSGWFPPDESFHVEGCTQHATKGVRHACKHLCNSLC